MIRMISCASISEAEIDLLNQPRQTVEGLDEVVTGTLVLLRALEQGSGCVHHVTGQEAILEPKVDPKRLDTDVLHAARDILIGTRGIKARLGNSEKPARVR